MMIVCCIFDFVWILMHMFLRCGTKKTRWNSNFAPKSISATLVFSWPLLLAEVSLKCGDNQVPISSQPSFELQYIATHAERRRRKKPKADRNWFAWFQRPFPHSEVEKTDGAHCSVKFWLGSHVLTVWFFAVAEQQSTKSSQFFDFPTKKVTKVKCEISPIVTPIEVIFGFSKTPLYIYKPSWN